MGVLVPHTQQGTQQEEFPDALSGELSGMLQGCRGGSSSCAPHSPGPYAQAQVLRSPQDGWSALQSPSLGYPGQDLWSSAAISRPMGRRRRTDGGGGSLGPSSVGGNWDIRWVGKGPASTETAKPASQHHSLPTIPLCLFVLWMRNGGEVNVVMRLVSGRDPRYPQVSV